VLEIIVTELRNTFDNIFEGYGASHRVSMLYYRLFITILSGYAFT